MARSLGVTQKVSSNSKHTLLCLCGHNVLERIKPNTIENTAVVRPVAGGTKPPRTAQFLDVRGENEKIPKNDFP